MKYAFMTFSTPELSLDETLALAKRYGYDGIEPRITAEHAHGIDVDSDQTARSAIRSKAESGGIALVCISTSCKFADPATQAENVEQAKKAIRLAADVGSPAIRVFGGAIGEGLSRQQAVNLVAASLGQLAPVAEDLGVTVCMETHDDWCDPADVVEVMERVGSTAVAVNWDIMHPVRKKCATMDQAFSALRPWIRHVHIHDAFVGPDGELSLDFAPIGKGYVDHKSAITQLRAADYDGYISGEWIKWSIHYDEHLPMELKTIKSYEQGGTNR